MQATLLFAHGSRDPAWGQPFEAMRARVQAARPDAPCALAYLELMQPDVAAACVQLAAQGVRRVRVLPVFLAAGKHLRVDLPELIAQAQAAHPQLQFEVLPPAGESAALQNAIVELALNPRGD